MSAAYAVLLAGTAAVGAAAMILAYRRSRDPFHPLLVACPIAVFLYVVVPVMLWPTGLLPSFLPAGGMIRAQLVYLLLFSSFCAGGLLASRGARFQGPARRPLRLSHVAAQRLTVAGFVLGCTGAAVWLALTLSHGGLRGVYSFAYGGGWLHPSGWVRESVNLTLVGAVLCLAAATGRGARARWMMAAAFAAPQLLHAWLGTRRGPAFVCVVLLLGGPYLFAGRRPRLSLTLGVGAALGLFLVLLVANRHRIYYGSSRPMTWDMTVSPVLRPDAANEYIVGSGLVIAAAHTGRYGWGLSYVEELLVRPIPAALLPGKYDLLPHRGVTGAEVATVLGWTPVYGSATTLLAHLFIEFGWASLVVAALIGAAYGWAWRRAVRSPAVGWLVLYLLLMQGLLHLLAQDVWAMAVPFAILFVPCWLALLWTLDRPFRRDTPAAVLAPAA